jgi:hypothetical protein
LTSNDEKISLLVRTLALSLLHQFSKRQHLAHSRDATNVILSENDDNRDLLENLSRDSIKRRINLQWLIIDTSSTDWRHSYNHANSIKTFATIANETTHVKDAFEKRILDKKLDTFLTTFRFRILFENDLEKLRQRSIKFDNVEISRKKISHKRHHESFKKRSFFEQTEKIDRENSKIERRSEREVWSETKKKKSSFKSKNFFTSHLRFFHNSFSHSSFTVYNIFHSWKTIAFDEFQNESHKKLDLNFESIEVIIFTMNNARNKHFSHERRIISRMKEDIHNCEWQSWSSRCFLASNANTQRRLHLRWLNQKIHNQRKFEESSEQFTRKRNSIKKCLSNLMNSLSNYWDNNF